MQNYVLFNQKKDNCQCKLYSRLTEGITSFNLHMKPFIVPTHNIVSELDNGNGKNIYNFLSSKTDTSSWITHSQILNC